MEKALVRGIGRQHRLRAGGSKEHVGSKPTEGTIYILTWILTGVF